MAAAAGGTLVALVLLLAAPWLADLLGAHQLVLSGSVDYLRAAAAGLPFLYVSYAGNGHLIGLADTRTPLRIAVTANLLNVALELLLVYGLHWGLLGSAWGTVAAQAAAAAMYAAASWRRAPVRPGRPGRAEVTDLLRDGHRLSVRTIALGVVQIAMRLWFLLALSLDALAVPAQVYVSSCLGAGDPGGAYRVGRRSVRLGLIAGTGLGVVTAGLAFGVPVVFTSDPAVRHAALVLRFHQLGLPGIWIALGLWLAARAALLGRRWRAEFRRRPASGAERTGTPELEDRHPHIGDLPSKG